MKVERPLIDNQVHRDAIVGSNLHVAAIAFNMDVVCGDGDIFVLRLLEDGGANIVDGLAIYGCKPRRTFNGVLELHVIDENGDDFDTSVDHGHNKSEEPNELEAA